MSRSFDATKEAHRYLGGSRLSASLTLLMAFVYNTVGVLNQYPDGRGQ
jgi:hypothetical protein